MLQLLKNEFEKCKEAKAYGEEEDDENKNNRQNKLTELGFKENILNCRTF